MVSVVVNGNNKGRWLSRGKLPNFFQHLVKQRVHISLMKIGLKCRRPDFVLLMGWVAQSNLSLRIIPNSELQIAFYNLEREIDIIFDSTALNVAHRQCVPN